VTSGGDVAILLPKGVTCIEDAPWDLVEAIRHAQMISFWQENLPAADMPPEYMWPFVEALNDWFDQVHAHRQSHNMEDDEPPEGWEDLATTFVNDDPRIAEIKRR
jgi:hypothetical protein